LPRQCRVTSPAGLEADPRITIEYGAEVSALHGADHLEALTIRDVKTGANRVVDTCALFIMVGAAPNTEWLSGLVKLDDKGFVITGSGEASAASPFATSLPGVFAVGDVRAGSVKRRCLLSRRRIRRDFQSLGIRQPQRFSVQAGLASLDNLVQSVPGVSIRTSGPGMGEFEMRGIASTGGNSPTVGFLL